MLLGTNRLDILPLRIGVSGAPGAGKTTLCEAAKEAIGRRLRLTVEVSKELARALMNKGIKINTKSEMEDYLAFFAEHMRRMRVLKGDVVLFDRTMLDVYAFMHLNGHEGGWLGSLADELVLGQMNLLRWYFYLPPQFDDQNDGVRIVDCEIIEEFDKITLNLLRKYRPDFITLRGGVSRRVNRVVQELTKDKNVLALRQDERGGSCYDP